MPTSPEMRPRLVWLSCVLAILAFITAPASAQVVFSEIHYHPVEEEAYSADGTPVLDLTDDIHEFVEIQNTGAANLNLGGWTLTGAIDFTFPAGTTIAAGGYKVIAKNPARLQTVYSIAGVLGPFAGKLGNSGDTVRVKNGAGTTVDAVTYSSAFPWAISANALGAQDRFTGLISSTYQYKGRSLQRVSVAANSNDPANWIASALTGPTPGAAQAITRSVPKPVAIGQSATQTSDGAAIVRANQAVTVRATFSSIAALSAVQLEYFLDNVNSTVETRTTVAMTDLGNGVFTAPIPGQADRSIVRYRFKANRGDGVETVSPRADDPPVAPIGASGAREAWHGYFVTPVRTSNNPVYDLLIGTTPLGTMGTNIGQSPSRVTAANATGLPRDVPYVAVSAPQWNGTAPAVFATGGKIYDVQMRYHGSRYHRSTGNLSFKLHYPEFQPYNNQSAWFVTGHGAGFSEIHAMQRVLGLPSSRMRPVDWYFNANSLLVRYEQGEFGNELLDEYHDLQQQLNPGAALEARGEFYKVVGNLFDGSQNNAEGPYTMGDQAPMLANAGWTQLQRFAWTYAIQSNGWKGSVPIRDLVGGMWTARGDSPGAANPNVTNARNWMTANFDLDATLTSLALMQWIGIWDDVGHNQFFWRRANGRWVRLGWDFDATMDGSRTSQTIYASENGAVVFVAPSWWKDTFFKTYRTEFKQRLWEMNNSFLDPANLTALGFPNGASFANARQANVNTQLALGTFFKPARPVNTAPAGNAAILGGANLTTSAYAHPNARAHASTKWEIRASTGNYEVPVLRLSSTTNRVSLPVPFDQLTYGQTYFWRATHVDVDNHMSIVSTETSFTWGTASTTAGTLVLNEILADNQAAVENAGAHPDYLELRNNGATTYTLAGLNLTDDPLLPAKYTFPAGTTLAAGASLVVWCDSDTAAPGLHTGFALNADGQTVLLLNGAAILDSVTYGPQAPDISIGRIVNGTGGWQATTPTPGAVNLAKTLGSVANLRINEWMASPAYGDDWFEIFNIDANPVALGNLYLSDDPAAPTTTRIPALSFIAGKGFARFVADDSSAGGHHANFKLSGGGDRLVLTAAGGTSTLDIVNFDAQTKDVSQGRFPDGATAFSFFAGTASPSQSNWLETPVVISEVLSNSSGGFTDAIEIFNPTASAVNIGGWWLSDDRSVPQKFPIPGGTTIAAGGYAVFYESQFNAGANAFSLSATGDEVALCAVDGGGALNGYRAQVRFGAAAENVSFGRVSIAGGTEFWPQVAATLGAVNGAPKTTPVILNEVMYHPVDDAGGVDNAQNEFIELHNPAAGAVEVGGWRIKGDSDFTFAAGASIPANGFVLLVSFDPATAATLAAFRAKYGLTAATPIFGPYSARLDNGSQALELAAPALIAGATHSVLVDKAEYRDIAPWPPGADGSGHSLQRLNRAIIGNDAANWSAAPPTPGAVNAGVVVELTISTGSPLPGGVQNAPYSASLAATGGLAPYAWNVSAGALPGGLTLNNAGVIAGTPAASGVFNFTAQVADGASTVKTKAFTLTIAASALTITTVPPLPDGSYGVAYSQTLNATGGTTPYVWTISAGAAPGGLSLSTAGVLSGTALAPGTFNFTARVADGGGLVATRAFTIFIPAPPLTITSTSPLPPAAITVAYSQALIAAGGVGALSWTISAGALPAGLSLSGAGDLTGTPTASGTFNFTARVTDSVSTQATRAFALVVTPAPLLIGTTTPLADGIVGTVYAQTLSASGGVLPYAWSIASGAIPGGLTFGSAGLLSGTPAAAGTFTFSARVTDSTSVVATKTFAVTVAASGPLDHFTWDYAPATATAATPFPVKLTARDAQERVVTDFSGTANLTAAAGAALPSPVVITEVTDESEDQFELQNVSNAVADTNGWFVRVGDSTTAINSLNAVTFALPASVAAGGLIRVSELNIADRTFFGGTISWNTTTPRGWLMLFDAQSNLRDFFVFGWSAAEVASLSILVNGKTIAPAASGQWSGDGAIPGTRGNAANTTDSWQRTGATDTHAAADFAWSLNTQTFGTANPGLALPWSSATPVAISPASATFAGGVFIGYATIAQAAAAVRLTAVDASSHIGMSAAFDVGAAPADTDGDGIPDAWENAHGLNPAVNDAALDADADGTGNRAEFIAGTDPQNAASRFQVNTIAVPANGQVAITWDGVAGKIYHLTMSADLQTWSALNGSTVLAMTSGVQSLVLDAAGAPRLFVRVEILPAE